MKRTLIFICLLFSLAAAEDGPRVLCVFAHPVNEVVAAAVTYKLTRELKGTVDVVAFSNGEGKRRHSILAESIYRTPLSDESKGRQWLSWLRYRESLEGQKILGIQHNWFLDQHEPGFTRDIYEPLNAWNLDEVRGQLATILHDQPYDFVFTMLPIPSACGHHQAATLLALETIEDMPPAERPIVLGFIMANEAEEYQGMDEFPLTHLAQPSPLFQFDRQEAFGWGDELNYEIIVNWFLAAHKSRGAAQRLMNQYRYENIYSFTINDPNKMAKAEQLFASLCKPHPAKEKALVSKRDLSSETLSTDPIQNEKDGTSAVN